MTECVWGIPPILGVMALSALLLFTAGVAASVARLRRHTSIHVVTAALVGVALVTFVALTATATLIARTYDISITYIAPGPLAYLLPPGFAGFAFLVGRRRLGGDWTSVPAARFCAWFVVFIAANVVNRCPSAWCTTVGFPSTWHEESDVILEGFGMLEPALHLLGGTLNLVVFVAVAHVLTRRRGGPPGAVAGPRQDPQPRA